MRASRNIDGASVQICLLGYASLPPTTARPRVYIESAVQFSEGVYVRHIPIVDGAPFSVRRRLHHKANVILFC